MVKSAVLLGDIMPYLVRTDVPVLVGQELFPELLGVFEEVSLVPGPTQQVLDPLALPRVAPLAPRVVDLGVDLLLMHYGNTL